MYGVLQKSLCELLVFTKTNTVSFWICYVYR
uniref:Uncharacterized protein n=1 Tax=Anguilla anguilla TaxID=7936 RepID=A0A0E9VP81_ANGAN